MTVTVMKRSLTGAVLFVGIFACPAPRTCICAAGKGVVAYSNLVLLAVIGTYRIVLHRAYSNR